MRPSIIGIRDRKPRYINIFPEKFLKRDIAVSPRVEPTWEVEQSLLEQEKRGEAKVEHNFIIAVARIPAFISMEQEKAPLVFYCFTF